MPINLSHSSHFLLYAVGRIQFPPSTFCLEISAKYLISSLINSTFHGTLEHSSAEFFVTVLPFRQGGEKADVLVGMRSGRKEFSVIQGRVSFVLFRPSTDCIRPTHTRENNLLYSVYGFTC